MNTTRVLTLALMLCPALSALAAEVVVTQKDKAFSTKAITVKVGDKVTFKNEDAFSHNIFSLTDAMPFDLGTYGGGQMKIVTFDKAGKFEIECAIHPDMRMVITVSP